MNRLRGSARSGVPVRVAAAALMLAVLSGATAQDAAVPSFADAFGSSMVLPHGEPLTLRGSAAANQRLTLQAGADTHIIRSNARGEWHVQISPLRAGGPYTLSIRDERGAGTTLTDVLAGELWLCSGQSNMEFPVAASTDQPAEAMDGHPSIRLLSIANQTGLEPRRGFAAAPKWQVATPETVRRFSALCYFFGREKIADEGVPIGLINASWGGSAIEAWLGEKRLARLPEYRRRVELLRQYRAEPRQAELAFAGDWVTWWQKSSTMGPVWEKGVLEGGEQWRDAPLQDWRGYPDPRLKDFTGSLWFSTRFELSEAQSRKGASFVLGRIDEVDTTWLNGHFVANTFGYGTRREYRLEPGLLESGTNQFSVFVTSTYDAGGMLGPTADVGIRFDDGEFLPLGAGWKYRFVPKETGYPPRAPWESVSGISGMFNGIIAPLQALQPTGVIWYQGESNVSRAGSYGQLLAGLIEDWRQWFGREIPFIVVQLPNHGAIATQPAESGWAAVRNAQQQVALRDPRVGMVVTQDLGDDADIHPRRKHAVALRTVQVARALAGRGAADGIVPRLTARRDDAWVIEFSPPLAPDAAAQPVAGFAVCGEATGSCVTAKAVQTGSRIEISRAGLPAATRLRFCWSDGGTCALRSLGGLPVASFELPLGGGAN